MKAEKFVENLTEARKTRNLTQKQVAQALGISDKTYSKWEMGQTEPGIDDLCRLADFYEISPAAFFEEDAPHKWTGALRRELKTLTPTQAMLRTRALMDEAYAGLMDNANWWMERFDEETEKIWTEELPAGPAEDQPGIAGAQLPEMSFIDRGNGFYFRCSGEDADLRLLLMPSLEKDAWIAGEAAELSELFAALSSAELMALLMKSPIRDRFSHRFSPEYLSKETGVPVPQVRKTLQTLCRFNLCVCNTASTAQGQIETYQLWERRLLRAVYSLAHVIVAQQKGEEQ